jgi:hypothetical protein
LCGVAETDSARICYQGSAQTLLPKIRTCSHRICAWIFEHNFDEGKAKKRKHTVVWCVFSTQQSAEFAEKVGAISYENKFKDNTTQRTADGFAWHLTPGLWCSVGEKQTREESL